jgi:hypothetical protein
MNNLILGLFYMFIAQVGTFIQLQFNTKYNWYEKYPIQMLLASIPLSWLYIHSVKNITEGFGGELWPSRIIGFGIGIVVFGIMAYFFFKEPLTFKTIISIILACIIILIQIYF